MRTEQPDAFRGTIVLIGGGRWSRVHAGALVRLLAAESRILWVSHHNRDAIQKFLDELSLGAGPRVEILDTVALAIAQRPSAAIVVTAPHDHLDTAALTVEHGIATLVEKPFGIDEKAAKALTALAAKRRVPLGVALPLLTATYLHQFAAQVAGRPIQTIRLRWLDPPLEQRHGELKAADLTVHKAHDIVPHLWSILQVLLPQGDAERFDVEPQSSGALLVRWRWRNIPVVASFGRRGHGRERLVQVEFDDGGSARLDFTREPGTMVVDGDILPRDPEWDRSPRPVEATLRTFLDFARGRLREPWPFLAAQCLGSVRSAAAVERRAQAAEAACLAKRIAEGKTATDPDVAAWLVDNLGPECAGSERLTFLDRERIANLVGHASRILEAALLAGPGAAAASTYKALPNSAFLARVCAHIGAQSAP